MDRTAALRRLADEEFDLLVIGGGITGAGVALDAVLRGLSVGLVERDDFASGTSSRSSKLIHGGLRYLQRVHLGQVRHGLHERRVLEFVAPHLVNRTPFLFPRFGTWNPLVRMGLVLYDVLSVGTGYPRHKRVRPDAVASRAPALRETSGALEYWDARTDDARLVWTILRTAADKGAATANHTEVVGLSSSRGVRVRDGLSASTFDVRARSVVNATGVWVDTVRALEGEAIERDVRPSKGIHIVVPASRVPSDSALILPTLDGRFLFVIPWENGTVVIGTTDDDYDGPLDDPPVLDREVEWVLDVVNGALASPLSGSDVVASFAGLRPLVAQRGPAGAKRRRNKTKYVSRRPLIEVSPSGLVTATGGKLTAWRPMAVATVDRVLKILGRHALSKTHQTRLVGAASPDGVLPALGVVLDDLGLDRSHGERLYHRYGSLAAAVLRMVHDEESLALPLHPSLPYLRAEAAYAIASEGAVTEADVLSRRLRVDITSRDHGDAAHGWVRDRLSLGPTDP